MKHCWIFLLITLPHLIVSGNDEAQLFFTEAQRLYSQNKETAYEKLNAAIALEPENRNFKAQLLDWDYRKLSQRNAVDDFLNILEDMLANDLARNAPLYLIRDKLFNGDLKTAWKNSPSSKKQKLVEFCNRFRTKYYQWYRNNLKVDTPPENQATLEDQETFYSYRIRSSWIFFDHEEFKRDRLANEIEYLKITDRFFRKHPDIDFKRPTGEWLLLHTDCNLPLGKQFDDINECYLVYSYEELREYLETAKNHIRPEIRALGLLAEFRASVRAHNFEPEKFQDDAKRFFTAFAELKLEPEKCMLKSYFDYYSWLREHPELIKIADEIGQKYVPRWCKSDGELFVEQLMKIKDRNQVPLFLLENKAKCMQFEEELLNIPLGDGWRGQMGNVLCTLLWKCQTPSVLEALEIFNHRMQIEQIWLAPRIDQIDLVCNDGIINGDELLLASAKYDTIRIDALNMKTLQSRNIYHYKTDNAKTCLTFRNIYSLSFPLDCDGELLLVGANDAIHIFRLDGTKAWTITDLPEPLVNAIALLDGRIYVWGGVKQDRIADRTMLFSCNLDGSDRRYHFNSKLKDKDRSFPSEVRGMLPDRENHRLLLLNSAKLYEYKPQEEKFRILMSAPEDKVSYDWQNTLMQKMNDEKLYVSFTSNFMIYDIKTSTSEWYFRGFQGEKGKAKYSYSKNFLSIGPFYPQGRYLWVLGHGDNHCYDTGGNEVKELHFYPPFEEKSRMQIGRLFPCPDEKSVLLLRGSDILKLTPRENVK